MALVQDLEADPFFGSDSALARYPHANYDYAVRPVLSIIDRWPFTVAEAPSESSKNRRRYPLTSSGTPITSLTVIDLPISVGRYKWSQVWMGYTVEESVASPVPVVIKFFLERAFPSQEEGGNRITGRSQIISEAWSYTRMKTLQGRQGWTRRSRYNHIFSTGCEVPWSLGVYKAKLLPFIEYLINL